MKDVNYLLVLVVVIFFCKNWDEISKIIVFFLKLDVNYGFFNDN